MVFVSHNALCTLLHDNSAILNNYINTGSYLQSCTLKLYDKSLHDFVLNVFFMSCVRDCLSSTGDGHLQCPNFWHKLVYKVWFFSDLTTTKSWKYVSRPLSLQVLSSRLSAELLIFFIYTYFYLSLSKHEVS